MPSSKQPDVVLLCTSAAWGGLEQAVARMAGWLQEEGLTVVLAAQPGTPLYDAADHQNLAYPWPRPGKYLDLPSAARLARQMENWGHPPLLIPHNHDLDFAAWAHRQAQGRFRLWYWQHMQLGHAKKNLFQRLRYARLSGWLSPLESLRQEAMACTTVPAAHIHIVPPGVDTIPFRHPEASVEVLRQRLTLPTEATILGLAGRLDVRKGQAFAIEALAGLPGHIHLALLGQPTLQPTPGPDYGQQLHDLATRLGLAGRVHFLGQRSDVATFYHAVDVVLMCTDGETYGLVTVEALAAKRPVLGARSGGTVELLGQGTYGSLYTPGNLPDFCQQIEAILAHPAQAAARATTGQAYVEAHASRPVAVAGIRRILI